MLQSSTDSADNIYEKSFRLFKETFGVLPRFTATAPGRVNLIGEHTDYNLLPALPMPLDQSVQIHFTPRRDANIRIINATPAFSPFEINLIEPIELSNNRWSNYSRAAVRAIIAEADTPASSFLGFDALVESNLPAASGLSSSSSLVIATCLAFLESNAVEWEPSQIAECMRTAEHFVGTAGGGMDQAVITLGQKNSALLVEFDPLVTAVVQVPDDLKIYVINSGVEAEKSGIARYAFNRRALECAIGVKLLKQRCGDQLDPFHWNSLRDIYSDCKAAGIPWQWLALQLDPTALTLDQIVKNVPMEEVKALCESKKLDLEMLHEWLPAGLFEIYGRISHVFAEADRVYALQKAFEEGDTAAAFHISKAGHVSCRDLYHISVPEIENLIATAESAGAGSARITGAGFGGCVVALVPASAATAFPGKMAELGIPASNIIKARSAGGARISPANLA